MDRFILTRIRLRAHLPSTLSTSPLNPFPSTHSPFSSSFPFPYPTTGTRQLCSKVSMNTSWGRMATRLKQDPTGLSGSRSQVEGGKSDKYMNHVKEHCAMSPEESVLKLQEQVQEEMASALSRTGAKLEDAYRKMVNSRMAYEEVLEAHQGSGSTDKPDSSLRDLAAEFNDLRKQAEYARWQLLIHRQALGFVHRNHIIVQEAYPLPKPIKDEEIPES